MLTILMRLALVPAVLLPLAACNTIEGAGQDIQAGGKAIEQTADKTQQEMTQ